MTAQQAAATLGVSRPSLNRFIREGALQSYHMAGKDGRKLLLRKDGEALKKRMASGKPVTGRVVRLERSG